MDIKEFERPAPGYSKQGYPMIFSGQIFQEEIEPSGTVTTTNGLRVGTTAKGIEIILLGADKNTAKFVAESGANIQLSFVCAESENGTYTAGGPAMSVTAPADGIKASPGECLWRIPVPNLPSPWVKCVLTFTGTFTGGKLTCALTINTH